MEAILIQSPTSILSSTLGCLLFLPGSLLWLGLCNLAYLDLTYPSLLFTLGREGPIESGQFLRLPVAFLNCLLSALRSLSEERMFQVQRKLLHNTPSLPPFLHPFQALFFSDPWALKGGDYRCPPMAKRCATVPQPHSTASPVVVIWNGQQWQSTGISRDV